MEVNRPTISVALATHNGARFIEPQLKTLAAQTRVPDELVICDDCSDDHTVRLVHAFAAQSRFPVRIHINRSHSGQLKTFERALQLCQEEIIFLCDQDDYWLPQKLARFSAEFARRPDSLVLTCDQELTDAALVPSGQTSHQQHHAGGGRGQPFAVGCCTAVRASFRELLLPIPDNTSGYDGWITALSDALEVRDCIPEVLQYHRRHGANVSSAEVNPLSQVRRLDLLRLALRTDVTTATRQRMALVDLALDRLCELQGRDDAERFPRVEAALERVGRERELLVRRLQRLEQRRIRRISQVLAAVRAGDYGQFRGKSSILRDLLARRSTDAPPDGG